jgi:hypothetical protein
MASRKDEKGHFIALRHFPDHGTMRGCSAVECAYLADGFIAECLYAKFATLVG